MVIGKVFINQQEELLGNIRLYTLAERRIEPGYLTFPLLTLRAAAITVGKRCIEATTFQGVSRCGPQPLRTVMITQLYALIHKIFAYL